MPLIWGEMLLYTERNIRDIFDYGYVTCHGYRDRGFMICDLVILLNDLIIYNHFYPHALNDFVECFRLSTMVLQAGFDLFLAS
jgi:hypothetical protein